MIVTNSPWKPGPYAGGSKEGVLFGGKVDLSLGVSYLGKSGPFFTIPYGAFGPGGVSPPRPPSGYGPGSTVHNYSSVLCVRVRVYRCVCACVHIYIPPSFAVSCQGKTTDC